MADEKEVNENTNVTQEQLQDSGREDEVRGARGKGKFFANKGKIDYKDADGLRRFTTERGKILPRRITGTCSRHQKEVAAAIKRARAICLLPFVAD